MNRRRFLGAGAAGAVGAMAAQQALAGHSVRPHEVSTTMNSSPAAPDLIAHWPFIGSLEEASGAGLVTRNHGVELQGEGPGGRPGAARFHGKRAWLEVEDSPVLRLGQSDFSVACWIHTDSLTDVIGDVISQFDPDRRNGWQLSLITNGGVTSAAQSNYRHLHFGIDDGRLEPEWIFCGRPGEAAHIGVLATVAGELYAGTLELGEHQPGHLWRYLGDGQWSDLGNPVGCNLVHTVSGFNGQLYAGVSRYNCQGSALGETLNRIPGGLVYRVEPDGQWVYCGQPGAEGATPEEVEVSGYETGKADDVACLTIYRGNLYCTNMYRRGVFVYEGGQSWRHLGLDSRLFTFAVYRDELYALSNGGPVYRYAGENEWEFCGCPGTSTQTYSAMILEGRLYVGTWPEGEVFRYEGGEEWSLTGRLGEEREVMAMVIYNGKPYIGSLPLAKVWRMESTGFTDLGALETVEAVYRRVWAMAVHRGRLYAGTLPSGLVFSIQAGAMATWDHAFPAGWHHLAAVRDGGTLRLYFDGALAAESPAFTPSDYQLDARRPLRIGFGMHDYFEGALSDLRLYRGALSAPQVAELAVG